MTVYVASKWLVKPTDWRDFSNTCRWRDYYIPSRNLPRANLPKEDESYQRFTITKFIKQYPAEFYQDEDIAELVNNYLVEIEHRWDGTKYSADVVKEVVKVCKEAEKRLVMQKLEE